MFCSNRMTFGDDGLTLLWEFMQNPGKSSFSKRKGKNNKDIFLVCFTFFAAVFVL